MTTHHHGGRFVLRSISFLYVFFLVSQRRVGAIYLSFSPLSDQCIFARQPVIRDSGLGVLLLIWHGKYGQKELISFISLLFGEYGRILR